MIFGGQLDIFMKSFQKKKFLKLGNFNLPIQPFKSGSNFSKFSLFWPKFAYFEVKLPNFKNFSSGRGAYMSSLAPLNLMIIVRRLIFIFTFKNGSQKPHFSYLGFLAWFCTSVILSQNGFFSKIFVKCSAFFFGHVCCKMKLRYFLHIIQPVWKNFFGEVAPTSAALEGIEWLPGHIFVFL